MDAHRFLTISGRAAGNGWNSPVDNAQWGTGYLNSTATAKSNMYDNRPAPDGTFSLYIRTYWADKAVLDGQWKPPAVVRMQ